MTSPTATARDMLAALYRHFDGRWVMLTEVTARTVVNGRRQRDRRIDALLLRGANVDGGIERLAVEIKVTRADFFADIRNPDKQAPWRALAHRHAYAVPTGLVRAEEVPLDSGLLTVTFRSPGTVPQVQFARRAPRCAHDPGPLPMANIWDAFYRAARLEAEAKGYGYEPHNDDDPDMLRTEVKRLRHELGLATEREHRLADKVRGWQKRWAAHDPPACGTCGKPLHIARGRNAQIRGHEWTHRDDQDAAMCELLRTAEAEREATAEGYRYRSTWVPGPEPADPTADAREDVTA